MVVLLALLFAIDLAAWIALVCYSVWEKLRKRP